MFVYNGFGRFGEQTPLQLLAGQSLDLKPLTSAPPGWKRLVSASLGHDTGWLLPAGLAAGAITLLGRRKTPRLDPLRAAVALWGTWLVVLVAVFSAATTINSYYTAALSPPVAALLGTAVGAAWAARDRPVARVAVAVVVAGSMAYAAWLIPSSGTGLPGWLRPLVIAVGAVATLGAAAAVPAFAARPGGRPGWRGRLRRPGTVMSGALCGALAAVLVVPAVACASIVVHGEGAFDTPFELASTARGIDILFLRTPAAVGHFLPGLERVRLGAPDLLATQTSAIASVFVYASGQEVLPIGGFTGVTPERTLAQLRTDVADGDFHLALVGHSRDPRIEWIAAHCQHVGRNIGSLTNYFCLPADAA
ncbi:MAG: hypothetical protein ABSE77_03275 [Acidimicrobiales bacterium]